MLAAEQPKLALQVLRDESRQRQGARAEAAVTVAGAKLASAGCLSGRWQLVCVGSARRSVMTPRVPAAWASALTIGF